VLTNSFTFVEKHKLQTWEPVSSDLISAPVSVFQNLMHLSAVPPPETKRPC